MRVPLIVERFHFRIAAAPVERLSFLQRAIGFQAQSPDAEVDRVPLELGEYSRADT
jgi:hypothetical protein